MKSFTEAKNYIERTSAKDIATRTAIYGAYYNWYVQRNFGHDIILDIVAALLGPFDFDTIHDPKIIELLKLIDFGYAPKWTEKICVWADKYATSAREAQAFMDMLKMLFNYKADEILEHFNYICRVIQPSEQEYFPEMQSFSGLYNVKKWPRI